MRGYMYGANISVGWPHRLHLLPRFYGLPKSDREEKGLRIFWLGLQLVLMVARSPK